MAVRLLRPYRGLAVNAVFAQGYTSGWTSADDEATLKATGNADDYVENASDYPAYKRYLEGGRLNANGLPGGLAAQATTSIPLPSGFPLDQTKVGLQLYRTAGQPNGMATAAAALIPAAAWGAALAVQVFYVDGVNGSDSNTGLGAYYGDFSAALKNPQAAITKANTSGVASKIIIRGGSTFNRASTGVGASVFPTVDLVIDVIGSYVTFAATDAHTWAVDATYPAWYSATESNCSGVVDLLNSAPIADDTGFPYTDRQGVGRSSRVEFTAYTSAALSSPPAGNAYVSTGGKTYVRRADGAAVTDANTRTFRGPAGTPAPAFRVDSTSKSVYVRGIIFEGGVIANLGGTRNTWFDGCKFMYAGLNTAMNGISVDFNGTALFTNCEASCNGSDGFNPHRTFTSSSLNFICINCLGWRNGRGTAQSCNGLTAHEDCIVVDVNGDYQGNAGGSIRCIGNSLTALFGTRVSGDRGDIIFGGAIPPTALRADDNAIIWTAYGTYASGIAATTVGNGQIIEYGPNSYSGTKSGSITAYVGP